MALSACPVYAQRDLKEIPPVDPELERQTFVLPEGFEVNLFAADPRMAKPIQINFDPQGRLWMVSSEVYPHIVPGAPATDQVLVLEDTDGDGVSDRTHLFAEGLLIPTGVAPGDGGAYVGAGTELLHLADDDGDLRADRTRVVLSGFGTEDTHHIIHTLRWGPEQRLYFSQSIYIHSHVETPWGVRRLNAGGIWQFRPDTLQLEVFARGLVNTWGTDFDAHGATFATDGAGGEGINYIVPGASYTTAFEAPRILSGLNPGSPKHCGLEIVESTHLPDDWQGSFITSDFRGHRVCRFTLREDGSGFVSQEQQEVIKSNHPAFRPIDAKLGPDGALYIADWYNPIIQHGEVDFRDERRDHTHGRIWRVTYKGKPLVEGPRLVEMETPQLVAQLASPNVFQRRQAQRLLKERSGTAGTRKVLYVDEETRGVWINLGAANGIRPHAMFSVCRPAAATALGSTGGDVTARLEVVQVKEKSARCRILQEDLRQPIAVGDFICDDVLTTAMRWANALDNTRPDYHRVRLEVLWLHLAHNVLNAELLETLLRCRDAGVRAAATRIVGDWHDRLPNALALLERRIADDLPRVRLEAVRALAMIRDPRSIEIAARALDPPTERAYAEEASVGRKPAPPAEFQFDRWLDYALWLTARDLQPVWEPALLRGEIAFGGNVKHLTFVLGSAGSAATMPVLLELLADGKVTDGDRPQVLEVLASVGRPEDLQVLLKLAIESPDDATAQQYLNALLEAQRRRKVQPAAVSDALMTRSDAAAPAVTAAAARLIGLWKFEAGREWLQGASGDGGRPLDVRLAAIDGLADFGGDAAAAQLERLAGGDVPRDVQLRAIVGLLALRPPIGARLAAGFLRGSAADPGANAPLYDAVLSRPKVAELLAAALDAADADAATKVPADVAVLGLRTVRASGKSYPQLEAALAKAGGVSNEPVSLTPEQLAALAARVVTEGDASRGEHVYRRQELACLKCHAIGDAGGVVGPNMLSLGATAQPDYIVQSLLDPNAKVKEGYHTAVIVDRDGRQWSGIKLRQTDTAVILRNAEGVELQVPLASIDVEAPGLSLMPAGLTEKLTQRELLDLSAFLAALGRVPEYTIGAQQVARRWQVLEATPEAAHQLRRVSYAHACTDDPAFHWQRVYSQVNGSLPLGDVPDVGVRNRSAAGERGIGFARCEIDVSQPGNAVLAINALDGLQAWLDQQPLELGRDTPLMLPVGRHRLTFAVARGDRTEPLRVELRIPEGAATVARFVGGL